MSFEHTKKNIMERKDKSRRQKIDPEIEAVVDYINALPGLCTTSSCSGRIMVLTRPASGTKHDCQWLFVSHEKIALAEIKKSIRRLPSDDVWFKFESFILHIAADTLEDANKVLKVANASGLRHSGIISAGKKFIVEITGNEYISTILAHQGRCVVPDSYLHILVQDANRKMSENRQKIRRFLDEMKKKYKKEKK
jgi:tRNA wybutosine-synthesizing protein 3